MLGVGVGIRGENHSTKLLSGRGGMYGLWVQVGGVFM